MKYKCGQEATHREDSAGYPLGEPLCNICFVEHEQENAAFCESVVMDMGLPIYSDDPDLAGVAQ